MNAPSRPSTTVEPPREPFARVFGLDRHTRVGLLVALAIALGAHGSAGARALQSLPYLTELARAVRMDLRERLRSEVDIDLAPPPPPPPPPLPPEPEPEPEKEPPPPPKANEPPSAPPPAAAEAGKVLTAEPDPDEPVDLTGDGFVTGTGERFAGGVTASTGTAKKAVRAPTAAATGTGAGSRLPVGPLVGPKDLSRPAGINSSGDWNDCGFPPEADQEGVNFGKVTIAVTVRTDGRARSVAVIKDPGYGFGAVAQRCAMRKTYQPALNRAGEAIEQTTAPFTVRFTR
jgi:periplasmic protein TonB